MESINEPVTVIIPAYNEESSIGNVVERVKAVLNQSKIIHSIIVVDDGSTDQTSLISQRLGVHVIRHERNRGYGAALKTGIREAQHEWIVITDADGTYPVEKIPEIVDKLQISDMVVGARVNQNVNIPLVRRPAKWMLKQLSEYITGYSIPDLNSGLRAFRRDCVQQYLSILSEKFSFTTTLTVAMLCDNYKITYVSIDYFRRFGKSKIVPWDFMNFVTLVFRLSMLFNPLKVFFPSAMVCFFLGGIKLLMDIAFAITRAQELTLSIFIQPMISAATLILFLSGLQILLIGMVSDGLSRKISQRIPLNYRSQSTKEITMNPAKNEKIKNP